MSVTNSVESLLALLQLSDSALPIGGYSHSWGLETWVQNEIVHDAKTAEKAIEVLLTHSISSLDGIACGCSHRCSQSSDLGNFKRLNEYLTASKWSKEPYLASTKMGQRLLKLAQDTGFVSSFHGLELDSEQDMHHSTVFGWLAGCAGLAGLETISAYLQNSTNCLVSACVRLIPLGHTDGQHIIVSLRPSIARLAQECVGLNIDDTSSFSPMNEAACFEHESLYSRLFQS